MTGIGNSASSINNSATSPINNQALNPHSALLQQQLSVVAAAQKQQQQQQQQQQKLHTALSRAVSVPQNATSAQVVSLMNTLMENLALANNISNSNQLLAAAASTAANSNGHRKLERTQSEPLPQQVNTSRYKTELCRPFEEAGECKYGEKCQFAHGYHELRNLQRHPKYKTEYCRTFHSVGFCPYGPRCHFVHNADEAAPQTTSSPPQQSQQQQSRFNQQQQQRLTQSALAQQQQQHNNNHHPLPLSPPLSMSTGSDRASPTGSLSPFIDQMSPSSVISSKNSAFPFTTPPESPLGANSPVNTPPPDSSSLSSSSSRLPAFNRLSSTNFDAAAFSSLNSSKFSKF
ncbi:ZFP36L2 family protein [Megaselia abdita]